MLRELKRNNYIRLTKYYLTESEFAFLDEIWKSFPAVLNTILTIINERKYHNGSEVLELPLIDWFPHQIKYGFVQINVDALDDLYDRFHVRLKVNLIDNDAVFMRMLENSNKLSRKMIYYLML